MARYLVLGDPVVALGPAALIPAHAYNARRMADGGQGGDRGAG